VEALLEAVASGVPLLADLHRADVLLYEVQPGGQVKVVSQGQPHSVPPIHLQTYLGRTTAVADQEALVNVLALRRPAQGPRHLLAHRAQIVQRAFPVLQDDQVIGVLSLEKSLVEHERHQTRRLEFRQALRDLREMVLRGETAGMQGLAPFSEQDGLMLVAEHGEILYLSGLGTHHYRRLGYSDELVGKNVAELETQDAALVHQALQNGIVFESHVEEQGLLWDRKVIPLVGPRFRLHWFEPWLPAYRVGPWRKRTVLLAIHDATGARRKAEEQAVRQAMVQEIHHRVKNNLQTLASLMRIQARRAQHEETRQALSENINRVLSFAIVHEFLSQHDGQTINLRDVAQRILTQVQQGAIDPAKDIRLRVDGPQIFLPAHQTTICALVINELLLNSLEHGFESLERGEITVRLQDEGDRVILQVNDTGDGLPENFNVEESGSLGLRIVRTVVQQDLRGTFELRNHDGVSAVVTFPKAAPQTFG
jgi:two-component sensor histidine kinase